MNNKWTTLVLAFLLAFVIMPCMVTVAAEKVNRPAPFLAIEEVDLPIADQLSKLANGDEVKAELFIGESMENLGIGSEDFVSLFNFESGKDKNLKPYEVKLISKKGGADFETAGFRDGKADYWRTVNDGETVVMVKVGEQWKPWFLLRCGNPVRVKAATPEKAVAQPAPPVDTQPVTPTKEVVATTSGRSTTRTESSEYCCPTPVVNTSIQHRIHFGDEFGISGTPLTYNGIFYPHNRRK